MTGLTIDDIHYGVDLMKYLKRKKDDNANVEGDGARFVFRELVQNADDASAKTLVIQFAADALLVANDGNSFENPIDFQRLANVLGEHKALDATKSGNFGSGFQTTFYISNTPEIHSNGVAIRLDPGNLRGEKNVQIIDDPIASPYGRGGSVFRFQWRLVKDRKAKNSAGATPFDDAGWKTWGPPARKALYDDLRGYCHHLLLTCQNVERIRLVWEDGTGLQIDRDFTCEAKNEPQSPIVGTLTHAEGTGNLQAWKTVRSEKFEYVVAHGFVTHDDRVVVPVYDEAERIRIIHPREDLGANHVELKRPDVWVLIPLFPRGRLKLDGGWLHSVIPLTLETKHAFVVSAHLFPEESRKDIDIREEAGEWCRLIRDAVVRVFADSFDAFVERVHAGEATEEVKQRTLLDVLPSREPGDWIHKLSGDSAASAPTIVERLVYEKIMRAKIVGTPSGWYSPSESTLGRNSAEKLVLDRVSVPRFGDEFVAHNNFERLRPSFEIVDADKTKNAFLRRWREITKTHASMSIGESFAGVLVDEAFATGVMLYLASFESVPRDILAAPDRTGRLRPFAELFKAPNPELYEAIPLEKSIPKTFWSGILESVIEVAPTFLLLDGLDASEDRISPEKRKELASAVFTYIVKSSFDLAINLERRPALRIFPTSNGRLVARNDVRAPILQGAQQARDLFAEAKVAQEWVDPAFHEQFETRIHASWKLPHPDYSRAVSKIDWQKKSASEITHYIRGLVMSPSWMEHEDSDAIIPVRGHLVAIRDALTGTSGSEELDEWFNVIPMEIQDELGTQAMARINQRVTVTAGAGTLIARLQRRCDWNPKRFDDLNEEDWRSASHLVSFAAETGWRRPYEQLRLIPVKHLGTRVLSQLPRFLTDHRNRGEHALRDEAWLAPKTAPLRLPIALLDRLKIVDLHPSVADATPLQRKWGLFELSETNVARHLIANYLAGPDGNVSQQSLFDPETLRKFIPGISAAEEEEVKRALLAIAQSYFNGEKSEVGLRPQNLSNIPLVYDSEKRWRSPSEVVRTLAVVGSQFHLLHDDFREWPPGTLAALGIKDRMDPDQFFTSVMESKDDEDVENLSRILVTLLTEEIDYEPLVKVLGDLEWVPTRDGRFCAMKDILLPLPRTVGLLGSNHPSFPFIPSDSNEHGVDRLNDSLARAGQDNRVIVRAGKLGLRTAETIGDLLDAIRRIAATNAAPPPDLIATISKQRIPESTSVQGLQYWWQNTWWSPREIFLKSTPDLPPQISGKCVRIVDSPDDAFLRRIGALDNPSVSTLLEWLGHDEISDLESFGSIWEELVRRRGEITEEIASKTRVGSIAIPPLNIRANVNHCLIDREIETQHSGNFTLIPWSEKSGEGELLRLIGATTIERLKWPELCATYAGLDIASSEKTSRRFLSAIASHDDSDATQVGLVCERAGSRFRLPLGECIYPDIDEFAHFQKHVAVVVPAYAPKTRDFLAWAKRGGMKNFSAVLREEPPEDLDSAIFDAEATERIKGIVAPLTRRLIDVEGGTTIAFDWITTLEVRRLPQIFMSLEVDAVRVDVARACYLSPKPNVLYVPYRGPHVYYDDLMDTILNESKRRGLVMDRDAEVSIRRDLHRLLTFEDWSKGDLRDLFTDEPPRFQGGFLNVTDNSSHTRQARADSFSRWYHGCQICGTQTPGSDQDHFRETQTAISGDKGQYRATRRSENIGNYLYLCPTHQVLFKRNRIRLEFMEERDNSILKDTVDKLEEGLKNKSLKPDQVFTMGKACEATETRTIYPESLPDEMGFMKTTGKTDESTLTKMQFSVEHYLQYLYVARAYRRSVEE